MKWILIPLFAAFAAVSCSRSSVPENYLDYSGRGDVLSGGVRMIPISTPKGTFRVWTKRIGSNPRIKVLLLHGGPAMTHEYLEAFDSYFPKAGIEYYYYDQLGSAYSDQPKDPELWELPRFVDEVEQVRGALGLDRSNFYLLGHYQWPDPLMRSITHLNRAIYVPLQGPRELGASGKLVNWDRTGDLGNIGVATLVIGAKYDTMDPEHMKMMAGKVKKGRYLYCPNGSHMSMYDDQKTYMDGVVQFIRDVDEGRL